MGFKMDYVTPSTGAVASFHSVDYVKLDNNGPRTYATVTSFVSQDAKAAGKFAMFTQEIAIDGLPNIADAFAFCEQTLVAAAPDGAPTGTNRYVFAGAELVA